MKIESLFVSGFLGVDTVEVHTPEPVQLFAGKNGAGKSSLRDAIALALTADLGRVTLKKEAAKLVRDGFDAAVCEVKDADGDAFTVSINAAGKITDNQKGRTEDPVLTYVLDAQRFARLEPNDRRSFLFGLMGVKTDPASVKMRLLSRNCDKDKVERVAPMLRAGFDAASKDAKAKATEAKGAWRAITGETYGSEKAKGWKASVPPHDADAMKAASTELQHCDVALEQWQQTIGKLQAQEQRRAGLRAQLPALLEHALRIDRIRAKLDTDQATLKDVTAQVDAVIQQAGNGPRVGLVHDMARAIHAALPAWPGREHVEAGWQALRDALDSYEAEFGKVGVTGGNADAALRLPELRKALSTAQSAVAHDQRDLEGAQLAKTTADSIETELKEAFDATALAEAREQADQIKAKRVTVVARLDTLKSIKAQIDVAEKKTADAAVHAADVAAWDAIGDALAPDGIPGDILSEALGPINERLAQSAADAEWLPVVIGADMSITGGGREYRLLSESEKWRVDAMLAEAVSHISRTGLLVLDRFDVLDPTGRQDLLSWLHTLADLGEIHTAFVFGTLKALPAGLPITIAAHWIENGVVAHLKEAA